jgi:hypothetical protein
MRLTTSTATVTAASTTPSKLEEDFLEVKVLLIVLTKDFMVEVPELEAEGVAMGVVILL